MDIKIRLALAADHDTVWEIIEPIVRAGDTYVYAPDSSRQTMLNIWFSVEKHTFVAEIDDQIVGTFFLKANQPDLGNHVANAGYMVHAAQRGRGIAEQMCRFSLREAQQLGFKAMQFNCVVATNEVAVRLWQKCGFEIIGTIPNAFQHAQLGLVNAHIMHQSLTKID